MLQPIRPQDAGQVYQRQVVASEASALAPRRADPATHASGGRRADRVQFSSAALDLHRALQAVAGASDVRQDRIEALRAAIADGTYRVDPDAIAEGMAAEGFLS